MIEHLRVGRGGRRPIQGRTVPGRRGCCLWSRVRADLHAVAPSGGGRQERRPPLTAEEKKVSSRASAVFVTWPFPWRSAFLVIAATREASEGLQRLEGYVEIEFPGKMEKGDVPSLERLGSYIAWQLIPFVHRVLLKCFVEGDVRYGV